MSSLAAARADNFYHPPDWDPQKEGRNEYQARTGKGNKRYTGHNQYAKWGVIRFEMPFNIWCDGCGIMIAKGVRFNAKKNHVGNYHSTKIWEFVMPCANCFNKITVRTDPKTAEYLVTKGGRRKVEEYSAKAAGTIELPDQEEREKIREHAMASLENAEADKRKAKEHKGRLEKLRDIQHRMKDDYSVSSLMRKKLRKRKKIERKLESEGRRAGIGIRILPATDSDRREAALVRYKVEKRYKDSAKAARISSGIFSSLSSGNKRKGMKTSTSRGGAEIKGYTKKKRNRELQKASLIRSGILSSSSSKRMRKISDSLKFQNIKVLAKKTSQVKKVVIPENKMYPVENI
eukprot:CAMPEP_0167754984 /NCGR_PEP_ID=MMETSP0110_2-20121227/8574_1 /TAXON_ID=629695 /ORGANISM="Gymnochlora sp., Strain CCMP2014" /LENGTH=346 /DNA_ID=CAMNT_0007640925 /DNA_START=21 /DNA_END=1062 /DNA_ORIENTATION=-